MVRRKILVSAVGGVPVAEVAGGVSTHAGAAAVVDHRDAGGHRQPPERAACPRRPCLGSHRRGPLPPNTYKYKGGAGLASWHSLAPTPPSRGLRNSHLEPVLQLASSLTCHFTGQRPDEA